jgi:hypothetical protein
MLDPAGPPKKDILKHAASNQNTNPNSYVIDYAPYIQQTEDQGATLLDHSTNKAIALESMEVVPASGLAVMTRYDTLRPTLALLMDINEWKRRRLVLAPAMVQTFCTTALRSLTILF